MSISIPNILNLIVRKSLVQLGYYSKPDFLIIGAQKAGTSALFNILKQHSKIEGALCKEVHFFDTDKKFPCKNYNAYHVSFPFPHKVPKGSLVFETTPKYVYHANAAERIHKYNPAIKLILCLRNPTDRALSAWTMFHYGFKNHKRFSHLYDERTFQIAIEEELQHLSKGVFYTSKFPHIERGIYHFQIQKYYNLFPKENILILEHNDIKNQHDQTIEKICRFLELPNEILPPLFLNNSLKDNKNDYSEQMKILNEFYKPHNELLYKLIGKEFNW